MRIQALLGRGTHLAHISLTQRPFVLRHREQRWVELHERRIHSRMLLMAGIARGSLRNNPRRFHIVERIKSPAPRQGSVLHMDLQSHDLARLRQPMFVQGSLLLPAMHCSAVLEHQRRPIRPRPCLHKRPVARRIHEDGIEHGMVRRIFLLVVAHIHTGAQVDPFAILRRELKLLVRGDHRAVRSCNRSDSLRRKNTKQHCRCHSKREQRSDQHGSTFFVVE